MGILLSISLLTPFTPRSMLIPVFSFQQCLFSDKGCFPATGRLSSWPSEA
jgi:hypothetical protein